MLGIFVWALMIPILFMIINQSNSDRTFVYANSDRTFVYANSDRTFMYANSDRTFVYVSNGGDGNIAVMKLNPEKGDMKLVEKVPAGPHVMHMTLSPDH